MMLTAVEAKELFQYDPITAKLYWATDRGPAKKGAEAGSLHSEGYRVVCVNRKRYYAHRIIWLISTGAFPAEGLDIDHINGDRLDNRLCNLRTVTRSENNQNMKRGRTGKTSSQIGVCWMKRDQKWSASIKANGRRLSLGYYVDEQDAIAAYLLAKGEHHVSGS